MKSRTILHINGVQTDIEEGETVLHAIRRNPEPLSLETPCNGRGTCGKCRIIILSGHVSEINPEEKRFLSSSELAKGVRLACYAKAEYPLTPIFAALPQTAAGPDKALTSGELPPFRLNPIIHKTCYTFTDDAEYRSLADKFIAVTALKADRGSLDIYRRLESLREETSITAVYFSGQLAGIEAGDTTSVMFGVAVDIGTTTVAASLLDLNTGRIIAEASAINPQTRLGADVLSRIEHVIKEPGGLTQLQSLIVSCLNALTKDLCVAAQIDVSCICGFTVSANTTMLHLLLGVNPASIAFAPYTPVFTEAQTVSCREIGLTHCADYARLYCLPSVSAYIGADITSGILVSGIANTDRNILFIDIGTNGEIVFSRKGLMTACSCAAGPALEGMNISCGMRASAGAVERVAFRDGDFKLETIGDGEPTGLCGSGVLDALAVLLEAGGVDKSGRIAKKVPEELQSSFIKDGRLQAYLLTDGPTRINFTQQDVRQVQLAKGALLSGFMALLQKNGLTPTDIDQVIIAGQFGKHLNEDALIRTGILPPDVRGKVAYIGNSSLTGAILALLDSTKADELSALARNIEYLELALMPGYSKLFIDCMSFPVPQSRQP